MFSIPPVDDGDEEVALPAYVLRVKESLRCLLGTTTTIKSWYTQNEKVNEAEQLEDTRLNLTLNNDNKFVIANWMLNKSNHFKQSVAIFYVQHAVFRLIVNKKPKNKKNIKEYFHNIFKSVLKICGLGALTL